MDVRLDTPFESWGGFSRTAAESPIIHGRLRYDPEKGIELELVENPTGVQPLMQADAPPIETMFGQLVDGTLVTLTGCFISDASIQIGIGIGSPTTIVVNRAMFGRHVADIDQLPVKNYSVELSSLSNWTCSSPVENHPAVHDEAVIGFDVTCRQPDLIKVLLPNRAFNLEIAHRMNLRNRGCSLTVTWGAAVKIAAHEAILFEGVHEVAWQAQNLMSLLVGERLSVRAITLSAADAPALPPIGHNEIASRAFQIYASRRYAPGDPNSDWLKAERQLNREQTARAEKSLYLVYHQLGKHDHKDVHPARMLLPYGLVKDEFSVMVERWFARSQQAVLATNVFFGSQSHRSPAVNVKFLSSAQAAESYHRSLDTGLYMDQAEYDAAMQVFNTYLPAAIEGDHRQSLKNRLKYGNEHSLRKRLAGMFGRIPENVRLKIANDVNRFIQRVVDTRNYYTHYDHASQVNSFDRKSAYIAAERIRILVVANLLHDMGIKDESLLNVLERCPEFQHWMSQPLRL